MLLGLVWCSQARVRPPPPQNPPVIFPFFNSYTLGQCCIFLAHIKAPYRWGQCWNLYVSNQRAALLNTFFKVVPGGGGERWRQTIWQLSSSVLTPGVGTTFSSNLTKATFDSRSNTTVSLLLGLIISICWAVSAWFPCSAWTPDRPGNMVSGSEFCCSTYVKGTHNRATCPFPDPPLESSSRVPETAVGPNEFRILAVFQFILG